ncbi:MAG: MarR family transcriptional regulator [Lachnospiraceae bacterium]|nr:MarR family transcriptional regulator [Lachnospiraceae bacterium]
MDFENMMNAEKVDFAGVDAPLFLLGLLSAFDNRYQAKADTFFEEISWKQFFAIICINLCKEAPTVKELAELMGSSHQNVKQILLKLEQKGFVQIEEDGADRRKQRIVLTEKTKVFCEEHEEGSSRVVGAIFQGISQEQLGITIQTILQMEENLKQVEIS